MSRLVQIANGTPVEDIIDVCIRNPAGAKFSCVNTYTRMDALNKIVRGTFPWIKREIETGDPRDILEFRPMNKCDIHIKLKGGKP